MHCAPVAHHPAAIPPVLLQDLGQQELVLPGPFAIDLVIGAHDRAGVAVFDGDLKSQQVALAQGCLINPCIDHMAAGLLVIERKVFEGADNLVGLRALDPCARQFPCEQGVFAQIFEIATAAWLAGQVGTAAQQNIEPLVSGFGSHHGTGFIG